MRKKPANKTKISEEFCIKAWKLLRRWKSFVLRWVLFCTREIFLCKNKQVWNCLDNLSSLYYSILLPSTPPPSFYYTQIFLEQFVRMNLFFFMRIFLNLFLSVIISSFLWKSFWISYCLWELFFIRENLFLLC